MTTRETNEPGILEHADQPFTVVLVRHAEAEGPDLNQITGPQLTTLGRIQAERLADRLAKEKFDHIYTSDLTRAYDTAREILKHHKNTLYTVTADIREVTHYHFVSELHPLKPVLRRHIRAERQALEGFADHLRSTHKPGEKVLVVCHGNFMRSLIPVLGGRDPHKSILIEFSNASVSLIDVWRNGEAVLKLANCVRHLLPSQVT
jgi:broad specificity phosphatase PhoE